MNSIKYCPRCKEQKEFYKNKAKPDGLASWCIDCQKFALKRWYYKEENKKTQNDKANKRRKDSKARLIDHFGDKCYDCGASYQECVYDFHHLDPKEKETGFGKINTCSWEKIKKEVIGKCVMLCSNCHRVRHHGHS